MDYYFSPSTLSFYIAGVNDIDNLGGSVLPADAIAVDTATFDTYSSEPPQGKLRGVIAGQPAWVDPLPLSAAVKSAVERGWRDLELQKADHEINKHNDGDLNAVGTKEDWCAYRIALREYPEQSDFPNGTRPTSPIGT